MKYIILLVFTLNLFASEKIEYRANYGFLYSGTILSNFKDARYALSRWLNDTASKHNGRVDVEYYDNSDSLYSDFKQNKLDMIVLNLDFYFKNRKEIDRIANSYWTLLSNDVKHTQLYLIARKSSNIKGFKNIRGKTLSIKNEDLTSQIWLDKNSLLSNKKSYTKVLKDIRKVNKESTTVLNVFFNKTDLAIVSKDTWDIMVELNPAVKKKLEIVSKSKKIHLPFIGLFSNSADEKGKKSFIKASRDIFALEGGEQISDLLKFDELYWIKDEDINRLDKYYQDYFKLQKKYK